MMAAEGQLDGIADTSKGVLCSAAELAAMQDLRGVMVVVEIISAAGGDSLLAEKGDWINAFFHAMALKFDKAVGCRLLWARACVCTRESDLQGACTDVSTIIGSIKHTDLVSRCALVVADTESARLMDIIGRLEGIVGTDWHFAEQSAGIRKLVNGQAVQGDV